MQVRKNRGPNHKIKKPVNGGGEEKTGCTREERREPDARRRLVGSEVRKVVGAEYHCGDPAMHHVWQPQQSSEGGTRR